MESKAPIEKEVEKSAEGYCHNASEQDTCRKQHTEGGQNPCVSKKTCLHVVSWRLYMHNRQQHCIMQVRIASKRMQERREKQRTLRYKLCVDQLLYFGIITQDV